MVYYASTVDALLSVLKAGAPIEHRRNAQDATPLVVSCMVDSRGDKIRTLVALGADMSAKTTACQHAGVEILSAESLLSLQRGHKRGSNTCLREAVEGAIIRAALIEKRGGVFDPAQYVKRALHALDPSAPEVASVDAMIAAAHQARFGGPQCRWLPHFLPVFAVLEAAAHREVDVDKKEGEKEGGDEDDEKEKEAWPAAKRHKV
jgi:hypothetical protein